jgi:outer membrane autotransporter protein
MLDPPPAGAGFGGPAAGFAPEQAAFLPPEVALAYAAVLKAPPKPPTFEQRWRAWGAGFGGTIKTEGDPVVGSNDVTARAGGFAAGADYRVTPDLALGFSLSGGGTNWGLAQGLGGGRSDAFQAGVYGRMQAGPAYLRGALGLGNHWMTVNRTAPLGDQLSASFEAEDFAGRLEGGYRYAAAPLFGVTPYAALQAQRFHTPNYSETDITGGGFGLSYGAMDSTDTRSELGARFDDLATLGTMPLILRGRAAWAHDWVTNPALAAVFQTLPGASFIVNGAAPPPNSALLTAGAELWMTPTWSLSAKFDGEFASRAQTYAGTATLRHVW